MNLPHSFKRFLGSVTFAAVLLTLSSVSALAASGGLSVSAGSDRSVTLGEALVIDSLDVGNPNAVTAQGFVEGSFLATLDWGDGSVEDVSLNLVPGVGEVFFQGNHVYAAAGSYTVEACLDDDGFGFLCDSFSVDVLSPEPALPDLIVESQFNPDDMSFDFTVSNVGLGDVPADAFPYLGFHFDFYNADLSTSIDTNYRIDDYGSGYKTAGGSTSFNTGSAAPEEVLSCTVYYLLVVDEITDEDDEDEIPAAEAVTESDEFNNEFDETIYLCPPVPMTLDAGFDQAIAFGDIFVLPAIAYNPASSPLLSATVDWGDGVIETAVQVPSADHIELQGSHVYGARDTFTITVCADDGVSALCDSFDLSVVGSSDEVDQDVELSTEEETAIVDVSESVEEDVEEDTDVELSGEDDEDCAAMTFEDVSMEASYYDSLEALWCSGVIHGRSATTFDPEDDLRRDEAAKIFTRLFGTVTLPYDETPVLEESPFVDVNPSEPLAYYVSTAAEEGLMDYETRDDGQDYFAPHDAMTVSDIISTLTIITGADATDAVTAAGYEADEAISRGNFMELIYSFVE